MGVLQQLNKIDWDFVGAETGKLTHDYHPYPAKFIPQIPSTLTKIFTREGETVLDPFVGCGTTLVEARILGRNCIGVDINPLAVLISKVKATPIESSNLLKQTKILLEDIVEDVHAFYGQSSLDEYEGEHNLGGKKQIYPIPIFHNKDYWFHKHVLNELAVIKGNISEIPDADFRDFALVCLSAIIVRVSNQDCDTRYVRKEKSIKPYDTFKAFRRKMRAMIKGMKQFYPMCKDSSVKVHCDDARKLRSVDDNSIDFVATSPPYLNAWDYHLYHRFRMFWLDMDPVELRKNEIGAHLEHSYNLESIARYSQDMKDSFNEMFRVLKRGCYATVVIGDSIVKARQVETHNVFQRLGSEIGFIPKKQIERRIDIHSKSFNPSLGKIKREYILVFKKP